MMLGTGIFSTQSENSPAIVTCKCTSMSDANPSLWPVTEHRSECGEYCAYPIEPGGEFSTREQGFSAAELPTSLLLAC